LNLGGKMKVSKIFLLAILCFSLCNVQFAFTQTTQSSPKAPRLKKTSKVSITTNDTPKISIRLNHLLKDDFVNIRSEGEDIEVNVGTFLIKGEKGKKAFFDRVAHVSPPSADSLGMGPNTIAFTRPASVNGTIYMDIQVPKQAVVSVVINGKPMLSGALTQPLSFRNGVAGQGEISTMTAFVRAADPSAEITNLPSGTSFVPGNEVQILQSPKLKGERGKVAVVKLEFNERGEATMAIPVSGAVIENLEEAYQEWKIIPHNVNGNPVRVITMLKVVLE
jgi:hypothetical protein